ncbi:MAG: DEAD/DEAH box helicase [Nocardioides sp.]|nr:DEAD/DEAH box helicase [Nocardioides sp.]
MSFVPVTGPATLRRATPARASEVEFTAGGHGTGARASRVVSLPIAAALPVLTRAHRRDDVHPSVGLLGQAAMLALRYVADGRIEPAGAEAWRIGPLLEDDHERIRLLAAARRHDGLDAEAAEELVRFLLDAVADTVPRGVPGTVRRTPDRASTRGRSARQESGPGWIHQVALSLRVEADDEDLVDGRVRVVPQVHAADDHTRVTEAALLWLGEADGFSSQARVHAATLLRKAAEAWTPLARVLDLRVPDEVALEPDEVGDLLEHGVGALGELGVDVLWPRVLRRDLTAELVVDRRTGPGDAPMKEGLFGPGALFAFDWRLAIGDDPLTVEEMETLRSATTPIVRLRDNWMVIDPLTAQRARRRLSGRGRSVPPAEALAAALTGVGEVDGEEVPVHPGASVERDRARLLAAREREPVLVPTGLQATLRDYQRQGLTWLAELTDLGLGACLADDMGLGKTITLIALHLHRREAGRTGPTLVVCPASLLGNWEAEVRRFAPGVPVRRFHGATRSLHGLDPEATLGAEPDLGFVLTTYGTLRNDAATLGQVAWDLVVADEAQHVKNARSSTARALREVGSHARVALTGTPVENDLTELWAILDWCTPGLLGSRQAFRRVWASPIESGQEPTKARQFADLVSPFLLRRRKSDPGVAPELPPKTETDHPVRLTREQTVLYETLVQESMRRIAEADAHTRRGLVLALLTGLKQICNHPAHYLKQATAGRTGRLPGRSEKLDLVDELLDTVLAEGGAVLVFTQYVAMARLLEDHLARRGVPSQLLHGGTPVAQREQMVADFQDGRVPVFLLSLKAGGTGLNLTRADHVVHFDRWWNPAVEEQATDRAYRIGQTRPVQVHRVIVEGTVEQRVAELLRQKRALADSVLAGGETALTELSDDELHDLVSLRGPG